MTPNIEAFLVKLETKFKNDPSCKPYLVRPRGAIRIWTGPSCCRYCPIEYVNNQICAFVFHEQAGISLDEADTVVAAADGRYTWNQKSHPIGVAAEDVRKRLLEILQLPAEEEYAQPESTTTPDFD